MGLRKINFPEESGSLLLKTQRLLFDTELTHAEIFLATNIPIHWLTNFARGKTLDPSVNRVQKLYEYLTGKPLKV